MTISLPQAYQNADIRNADVTQTMLDLYNVVQQINTGLSPSPTALAAPNGSSLVGYIGEGPGTVALTVQKALRNIELTVKDLGAVADGVTDDRQAFVKIPTNTAIVGRSTVRTPAGTYNLSSDYQPAFQDIRLSIDPSAVFNNGLLDQFNLAYQIGPGPVLSHDTFCLTVDSTYDPYYHVVGQSIALKGTTAGAVSVALYTIADAAVSGHHAFGLNPAAVASVSGGVSIACEIDSGVTASGGVGYGLVMSSYGSFPSENAITIQANNSSATWNYGIEYDVGSITSGGYAFKFSDTLTLGSLIYAPAVVCTNYEINLPSFRVGPSVSGATGVIRIDASSSAEPFISVEGSASIINIGYKTKSTGEHQFFSGDGSIQFAIHGTASKTDYLRAQGGVGGAVLTVNGSSTNADAFIQGKGSGGGSLADGGGVTKIACNTTGIGFFAVTPVARQTITGSLTGDLAAVVSDLLTKLALTGIFINGVTA